MNELIKITTNDNGQQLVGARELYDFLEVKKDFTDWFKYRVGQYDFEEEKDFTTILGKSTGGRPSKDYAITIEMAKELSMVESNEKGKEARKYFIKCEKKVKEQQVPKLSKELQAIFMLDGKQQELEKDVKELKNNMPLLGIDCDELTKAIKKKCTSVTGYKTAAYKDKSLRGRVYSDIHHQLRREFGVSSYKAIKRSQVDIAKKIVTSYKAPMALQEEIVQANNQVDFEEVI